MGFIEIFHIILLPILIPSLKCLVIDPLCQECLQIDSSLVSTYYRSEFDVNLTLFDLPGFSLSTIVVDFRHLKEFPLDSNNATIFDLFFEITDVSSQTKTIKNINDTIIGTNVYELETTAEQTLTIFYMINNEYKEFQYMLRESVSLNLSYSNNRIPTEDSSYVFVVTSLDVILLILKNINLPINKPDLSNMNNFYLENQRNTTSYISTATSIESTMYWSADSQFAVPYFPYFSNCNDEGNMMHVMQMLENETDCQLVPLDETRWINEFSFGSSANADSCLIKRQCIVDGNVESTEYPFWMTLTSGLNLFQISQEKIPTSQFSYNMNFLSEELVGCKIGASIGSNTSNTYPLKVMLSMGYYQVSETEKRIITCIISYDLYVPSTANFTYQLEISSYPLNHTHILLNFGFNWYVYMIVFMIFGIIQNIENLILWFYHYFVAEEKKEIKIFMYFRIIKEITKGTIMALLLLLIVIVVICSIMNGKIFQTTYYNSSSSNGSTSPRVLFDLILENPTNNYDSSDMQNLRAGRMGVAFLTIGIAILFLHCKYFVGKEKIKKEEKDFEILGRIFKPLEWVRGKFFLVTFIYIFLNYLFISFAYSTFYSDNIWTFIVVMKVLQVIMEEITKSVFDDALPGLPFKIITDVTGFLNTVSAADLYDFLFGALIDVALTLIEKLYIFQIENMIVDKLSEKSEEFNRFYVNLMNEEDGEEEENDGREVDENAERIENENNQQVFIYRETQEVQFFEEEIKETYNFNRIDEESRIVAQCKETDSERRLKKRYFESLSREYRNQRQLLLNREEIKAEENIKKSKNNAKNKDLINENEEGGEEEIDEQEREEAMEEESKIFEVLLDHMGIIYTFLFNPFVLFIMWIVYDESQILSNYGITYSTVVLYILSAIVIGVFSVINIIMIFHMLENYIGMSFEEQINDVLMRFDQRKTYWKTDEEELNDKLKPEMLGADHYCLSSQLFFVITVFIGGMFLVILGIATMFQTNYNFFSDVAAIPVALFWIGFLQIFIFFVKKLGVLLNIWDYKKYKEGNKEEDDGEIENMMGMIDQKELVKMMEENSDFKTENVIFAEIEELPRFKKFFNTAIRRKEKETENKEEIQLKSEEEKLSINEEVEEKEPPLKKKILQNYHHLPFYEKHEYENIILAQKFIETICKKLEPLFNKEGFRLEYSKENRNFIKENIEKILPFVDYLPELQEFKNILVSEKNSQSNKFSSKNEQQKQLQTKRQENGNVNKNMDPIVTEMILEWLRVTEKERQKRIENGPETESKIKKCSFCYETWGLYYGPTSMCLECTMKMNRLNKEKEEKTSQNNELIKSSKQSFVSSKETNLRKGKKKKSTKKKNKLNIITEEEDFDDEDEDSSSESDFHDHSSGDEILDDNSKTKWHHE